LADQFPKVTGGLDCDPETCKVKFPKEFAETVLKFYKAAPKDRAEIIKGLGDPKTDLRIKNIDLIPGELLRDATSRNYIASLSINNKKNAGSNEWQENYDTNDGGCQFYNPSHQRAGTRCSQYLIDFNLFRDNSRNTGFRYAYACETKLETSCKLSGCVYDPTKPFHLPTGESVYVKRSNIMRPDGKGVDEETLFTDSSNEVIKFPRTESMTLRLCQSRSIYYATQVILNKESQEKRNGYFAQNDPESESRLPGDTSGEIKFRNSWFLYLN